MRNKANTFACTVSGTQLGNLGCSGREEAYFTQLEFFPCLCFIDHKKWLPAYKFQSKRFVSRCQIISKVF